MLIFTACVTTIQHPLLIPAEIDLGANDKYAMIVVNWHDVATQGSVASRDDSLQRDQARYLASRLTRKLDEVPNFEVAQDSTLLEKCHESKAGLRLSPECIRSIDTTHQAQFIVALEEYAISIERLRTFNIGEEDLLNVVNVYANLIVEATISIYDTATTRLWQKTLSHMSSYTTKQEVRQVVADLSVAIVDGEITKINEAIAQDFFEYFFPLEITVTQDIYNPKALKIANQHMRDGEWDKAIDDLFDLDPREKNKTRAKACFNLAVCYRALGDYENADYWYQEAARSLSHPLPMTQPFAAGSWFLE